jgi:triphosphoribosyl-dephospho-CoA synthetase
LGAAGAALNTLEGLFGEAGMAAARGLARRQHEIDTVAQWRNAAAHGRRLTMDQLKQVQEQLVRPGGLLSSALEAQREFDASADATTGRPP